MTLAFSGLDRSTMLTRSDDSVWTTTAPVEMAAAGTAAFEPAVETPGGVDSTPGAAEPDAGAPLDVGASALATPSAVGGVLD